MKIHYLDALCGAGKTYQLLGRAADFAKDGDNVIFCQPTKELIDRTVADLKDRFPSLLVRAIHGGNCEKPVAEVNDHLHSPQPGGHILFITHASLERLRADFKRENWRLIVDEIPSATRMAFEKNLSNSFSMIGPYLKSISSRYDGYYQLACADHDGGLRDIADNRAGDDVTELFRPLASKVLSDHWLNFTPIKSYDDLVRESGEKRKLTVFSLLQPSLVEGFKSVTISGACFTESLLYKYWTSLGVQFVAQPDIALRYRGHGNGSELAISYFIDQPFSKKVASKTEGALLRAMQEAVLEKAGEKGFLFAQNKCGTLFKGVKTAQQLPNDPHGLNDFQRYADVVYLSARNLTPLHGKFLQKAIGIGWDEIHTAIQRQVAYQTIMRGALRDPENHEPKRAFVPDRATAEWLQTLFPDSTVSKLKTEIDEQSLFGERGRKKIYNSATERKRASRNRQQIEELEKLREPVILDITTIQRLCHDNTIYTNTNFVTNFRGTFFSSVKSEYEKSKAILDSGAFKEYLEACFNNNRVAKKEENYLISPAFFDPDAPSQHLRKPTKRGKSNVLFAKGIWLDIDGGSLTPDLFSEKLFPNLEMVIYSSYNSKIDDIRYRVYILTDGIMTNAQYNGIVKTIRHEIAQAGYRHKTEADSGRPTHGMDKKLNACDLFYIPCQPTSPSKNYYSFFENLEGGERKSLNTREWIEKYIQREMEEINSPFIETPSTAACLPLEVGQGETSKGCEAAVAQAIEWWREVGPTPHEGNDNFFKFGMRLAKAGCDETRIEEILGEEARWANTPEERLDQIESIISSLYNYDRI